MKFSEKNYYKTNVLRGLKGLIKTKIETENNQNTDFISR